MRGRSWPVGALLLLSPLLAGGAHCGYTVYAGPTFKQEIRAEAAPAARVRIHREKADYTSASLVFVGTPEATVRPCAAPETVIATVRGNATVPINGNCVEVTYASPSSWPGTIVTDIGRQVVVQRNYSPHDSNPPQPPLRAGDAVGEGDERWTLWSVDIIPAGSAP